MEEKEEGRMGREERVQQVYQSPTDQKEAGLCMSNGGFTFVGLNSPIMLGDNTCGCFCIYLLHLVSQMIVAWLPVHFRFNAHCCTCARAVSVCVTAQC